MSEASWAETFLKPVLAKLDSPLTHIEALAAVPAEHAAWPDWVPSALRTAYANRGIDRLWRHQVEAASAAWDGQSVVIATGTATGKSVGYQLPVLARLLDDPKARALYLAPTKALGHDQLRSVIDLSIDPGGAGGIRPAAYDGDTPQEERQWAREHSRWLFSNPDMLSRSIMPNHPGWHMWLRRLRYVVIDECHVYRGVFGSHIAHVLRRLRRLCHAYGNDPVVILASATARNPGSAATRLVGVSCEQVTDSQAPRGERTFALWEPPLTDLVSESGAPIRRAATSEAARLLADLVIEGRRSLVFVRSRKSAETVTLHAQELLREAGAGELAHRVAAYRAGYLPSERRDLEQRLSSGELLGAAATTALELGIDIAGLDAVIVAGFPGTLAGLWQQVGRAGRRQDNALAVFVARDEPLDTYLTHHPEAIFNRPIEATVIDPHNPYVLRPQLTCAAYERPITEAEIDDVFGGAVARECLDELAEQGVVRRRPTGWYFNGTERPQVDIRGSSSSIALIEQETGRLIGTMDGSAANAQAHPGAVYLHRGETWVVDELHADDSVALLHADNPDFATFSQEHTDIRLVDVIRSRTTSTVDLHLVDVEVTSQVLSFERRRVPGSELIDRTPLEMPAQRLRTRAVLWTLSSEFVEALGPVAETADLLPGALHAAEHASIGLLPLIATCDRWDIGGVSTAMHPDTLRPSVFVYDGQPGGAGFAEQGFNRADEWLGSTLAAIIACECRNGCPSCVQSPKCGNGNNPLSKSGAIGVLRPLLAELSLPSELRIL